MPVGASRPIFKCLECHKELAQALAGNHGYHARLQIQNPNGKDCVRCHLEHNGENYNLIHSEPSREKFAIEALGSALEGSGRPLLVTSGLATMAAGRLAAEEDAPFPASAAYPRVSEAAAATLLKRGVRASVVRLPQVHDTVKQGLVTYAIAVARDKGASAYVGDGLNRWAAVHRLDAVRLYRLALEKQEAGARYHAVAEEGVPVRDIAGAIGRGLKVPVVSKSPEEAAAHFGWLGMFVGIDLCASSVQTQERLGWRPTGPGLIADLNGANYFEQTADAAR